MSYCRLADGDSDVYLYHSIDGPFVIIPRGRSSVWYRTRTETLAALGWLRDAGFRVPERAFTRLRREREEEGET